jgi:dihydrodipicolinate synthase/N-acetylneuraminate lyase
LWYNGDFAEAFSMPAELPRPLRGVVPPMITPLLDRDELDAAGLERLVEHILAGGVSGLFILGTTGEAPGLSDRLRCQLIERTCRHVSGRVPLLVGITDTAFAESVHLACKAAEAGAQAVVVAAPYYFAASQPELAAYLQRLVGAVPLPVFLYNAPAYTRHFLELDTVRRLSELPNVLGVKDSSLNMVYFHKLLRLFGDRGDFTLLVGPEELMAEAVLLGGHGGMCGGANIYPNLYVDLCRAAASGDLERVQRLQSRVMQISATAYHVAAEDSGYLRGLKCAVSLMGVCGDFMAEPFQAFGPLERAEVRRHLVAAGLLEA